MTFVYRKLIISTFLISAIMLMTSMATARIEDFDVNEVIENGINIDLKDPIYENGTLFTDKGGVASSINIRIQANCISYTKNKEKEVIFAEGNLLVEFGEYIFIGKSIEYDFEKETGVIINGRTSVEPWFFVGSKIQLCSDRSVIVRQGYITTSQSRCPDWAITSKKTTLKCKRYILAENVQFKVMDVPIFWLPRFQADIKMILDSPIHYTFRIGGRQGPRVKMRYEVFASDNMKTFLQFDYRLNRGPGIGLITDYCSPNRRQRLEMINYFARDSSVNEPSERYRYRYQGCYFHKFNNDRTQIKASWDKLSDKDMPEDYNDETFKIEEAGKTQLLIRHQEPSWISNLATKLQINGFQTVKQELPAVEFRFHPYTIANSRIISESLIRAGFLDYDYANNSGNVLDYCSTRFELRQSLYHSFCLGPLDLTPEAAIQALYYGSSPTKDPQSLFIGLFSLKTSTHMYRFYKDKKHVLEPYLHYNYYTFPTTNPSEHFIFDIEDGWYYLNALRLGINNNVYYKSRNSGCVHRYLNIDLFTYAFFNTATIPNIFQKIYCQTTLNLYNNLKYTVATAWNIQENQLDHYNCKIEWTASDNFAISTELRHRGAYDWRKVDHDNFVLDSYRSISELRNSSLSDRRDTLLLHTFYRFHPYCAIDFQIRHGWNREFEPSYIEYQADLITNLGSGWNIKLSYQHREEDQRIALYFSLGTKKPKKRWCCPSPCIEF